MFINILYLFIALAGVNAESADEICQLTPAANGFGKIMSCAHYSNWFSYHPDQNECLEFSYGGCGGNENRFQTKVICEDLCKNKAEQL
ncbi:male accessory gland serine protease inhibitor [Drosophila simulans]|uniref:male accessory gland serine protease inhibitor n=1 Tax=Drosophila simulans TaxID=7240 RepID=UPI00192CF675|nr:male accessory gland serine protease inhibitor [Drosophila simulans]